MHNDQHVITNEEYVDSQFYKYVNNDGNCIPAPIDGCLLFMRKHNVLYIIGMLSFRRD
jgi:hypothetical protein